MITNAFLKSISLSVFILAANFSFGQDMSTKKDKEIEEETKNIENLETHPYKDIVSNTQNSKDHTLLSAAIIAADLKQTLQGEGPYTVFAPTDTAFEKLSKGTLNGLLENENKEKLQSILTYHVLVGKYTSEDLIKAVKKGKGKTEFKTLNGKILKAMFDGKNLKLIDETGHMATVTIIDAKQSNGFIHVIDTVLSPGL
ncbi:fasciclin domain-containing protein [Cellulophaga sp. L1A9]|uniref:fasciclin domain-containing protein n=1 Tax=Cellulophaga sp. L1A9 TaxID=2686362 RepID=UPI00131B8583|nr:fasciclin domain-containing protein [Cellulophaga sp. L1A9]